jgi:predicted DNA-binding protein
MVRTAPATTAGRDAEMAEGSRRGVPVSVRIPPELSKRLEKLVPKLAKEPAFTTLGIVTKSSVVKLALLRGVEVLEREYSK